LTAPLFAEATFTGARLDAGLMARRTLRDVNAAALDASNRTTKRARLLRQILEMAPLLSRRVLKERNLFPLIPDLLNVLPFVAMAILLKGAKIVFGGRNDDQRPINKLVSGPQD
jgi:hypothetical protein